MFKVKLRSQVFGTETFTYDTLDDAIEGATRLARSAARTAQVDGTLVSRFFG